ncbi:hypothetical protein [Glaciecola sp. KUL10]|uniref:hypothetical protein n=1 Tax=Glaciecola sp. (strain KUL10) TaxID=2161813 RepID=UPI000D8AE678|nr:hypothetical protein [Glaciecola sp. KUL10]GBL04928.1 hypothetical protein KUL10_22440 [Glaciecola sp. KUL10]
MSQRVNSGETIVYATETIRLLRQTETHLEALNIATSLIVSDESPDWKGSYFQMLNEINSALINDSSALSENIENVITAHRTNFSDLERAESSKWKNDYSQSISHQIASAIQASDNQPKVILCTTQSLIRASSLLNGAIKLPVFIDEGFMVADHGEYITATDGEINGIAAKLELINEAPDDYSTNDRYELPEKLLALKKYVNNKFYDIEISKSEAKLQWIAKLDLKSFFNKFSAVTLLAACHEDTIQFHAIKSAGFKQKPLDWKLATKHFTSGTIHVYWVLEQQDWLTTFKKKLSSEQLENIGLAFEQCHFSNEALSVKGISGVGKPLPVKSHGFNDVAHNHHFLNLHTQMPYQHFSRFLEQSYGMSKKQIRQAYYQYDAYQAALRVSLRNSTRQNPSTVDNYFCFGDKGTAEYFISKLDSNVKVEKQKLTVYKIYEDTHSWIVDEVDRAKERADKVSATNQEKKNRAKDKRRLLTLKPNLSNQDLSKLQLTLRDWRREKENKGKRVTDSMLKTLIQTNSLP